MKKFKIFLVALVCALCLCSTFAGCGTTNAEYIENSFTYEIAGYSDFSETQIIRCRFNINIKKTGKYKVEYTLYGDYSEDDNNIYFKWKEECSEDISSEITDEYAFYKASYIDTTPGTSTVTIRDIKITEIELESYYTDIALGLGISASLLTAGLIILFVLEKKGTLKVKNNSNETH